MERIAPAAGNLVSSIDGSEEHVVGQRFIRVSEDVLRWLREHHDHPNRTLTFDHIGAGATRCRTFHSKLLTAAIDFMSNQINDWLDGTDDIVIKFATSTIGPFEGKHTEQNLIISVFY